MIIRSAQISQRRSDPRGSVLLEVILALALFVTAATIISSGINASIQAVSRLRNDSHAANLAISVLSELSLGTRSFQSGGPEPFPAPFDKWTLQIDLAQLEESTLQADSLVRVEVIIRHTEENVVHRLSQLFRASETTDPGVGDQSRATFPETF